MSESGLILDFGSNEATIFLEQLSLNLDADSN